MQLYIANVNNLEFFLKKKKKNYVLANFPMLITSFPCKLHLKIQMRLFL